MARTGIREAELYAPIKLYLEGQGYEVKGEVGAADIVALRGDEEPLVVELKSGFGLGLYHQAIERQSVTDTVYVAVPRGTGKPFRASLKKNRNLCRRLGLGLMTVRLKDGFVEVHLDPAPYTPRKVKRRKERLLREFSRLVGDPNTGGSDRKAALVTAYRQDALRCLNHLRENGPTKAAVVAKNTSVENARRLMADNHYGWFERVATGIYALSPKGEEALEAYAEEIGRLAEKR